MAKLKKKDRHEALLNILETDPFLTDEELSEKFEVSIQTIRLDRLSLNIPELRERVKSVATNNYEKVRTLGQAEIVGELIDLELNKRAISFLQTDDTMAFQRTRIVKGHYIFAMAESLAMAVVDANVCITGVANMKYRVPVAAGQKLVAKAELTRVRGSEYFVHVKINVNTDQVFRSKFILTALNVE
ncbi:transcription factor FapR [Fusibacter sp. JL216-2]|uniref:transcription factor FapR n=1 Tax=Fusibacter sp. JL216-2 TaxID=3071453 RepID=UPI003D336A69